MCDKYKFDFTFLHNIVTFSIGQLQDATNWVGNFCDPDTHFNDKLYKNSSNPFYSYNVSQNNWNECNESFGDEESLIRALVIQQKVELLNNRLSQIKYDYYKASKDHNIGLQCINNYTVETKINNCFQCSKNTHTDNYIVEPKSFSDTDCSAIVSEYDDTNIDYESSVSLTDNLAEELWNEMIFPDILTSFATNETERAHQQCFTGNKDFNHFEKQIDQFRINSFDKNLITHEKISLNNKRDIFHKIECNYQENVFVTNDTELENNQIYQPFQTTTKQKSSTNLAGDQPVSYSLKSNQIRPNTSLSFYFATANSSENEKKCQRKRHFSDGDYSSESNICEFKRNRSDFKIQSSDFNTDFQNTSDFCITTNKPENTTVSNEIYEMLIKFFENLITNAVLNNIFDQILEEYVIVESDNANLEINTDVVLNENTEVDDDNDFETNSTVSTACLQTSLNENTSVPSCEEVENTTVNASLEDTAEKTPEIASLNQKQTDNTSINEKVSHLSLLLSNGSHSSNIFNSAAGHKITNQKEKVSPEPNNQLPAFVIPPPPPLPSVMQKEGMQREIVDLNQPMKPLHWRPIRLGDISNEAGGIWKELKKVSKRRSTFSGEENTWCAFLTQKTAKELEELFCKPNSIRSAPQKNFRQLTNSTSNFKDIQNFITNDLESIPKIEKTSLNGFPRPFKLLSPRKAQNIGIFIFGKQLTSRLIKMALMEFDENVVTFDTIKLLNKLAPDTKDIDTIQQFVKENPHISLDRPEQFIYDLSQIPHFRERLQCLIIYQEHQDSLTGLQCRLDGLLAACQTLQESRGVRRVLGLILSMGNKMNWGTPRGRADGFDLEVLGLLKNIKANDNSCSLLLFLIRQYLDLYVPDVTRNVVLPLLDPSELKCCLQDLTEIYEDIQKVEQGLNECARCLEVICGNNNTKQHKTLEVEYQRDSFSSGTDSQNNVIEEKIKIFLNESKKSLKRLTSLYMTVTDQYTALLDYYCLPRTITPIEFFTLWLNFSIDFKDLWMREIAQRLRQKKNDSRPKWDIKSNEDFNTDEDFSSISN